MKETPIIRPADPEEAAKLTELALRSKAHWGYSKAFIAACREELTVEASEIRAGSTQYYVCALGQCIVGYFAIEPTTTNDYELDALFVDPQHIGQGFGRKLMDCARKVALERGATGLLIQGDPHAESFYIAAGAVKVGERESRSIPGRHLPEFRISLASRA